MTLETQRSAELHELLLAQVPRLAISRLKETALARGVSLDLKSALQDALVLGLAHQQEGQGEEGDAVCFSDMLCTPHAFSVRHDVKERISELAKTGFGADLRKAAGYLVARGLGLPVTIPAETMQQGNRITYSELRERNIKQAETERSIAVASLGVNRAEVATSAKLSKIDKERLAATAPSSGELKAKRIALINPSTGKSVSQRKLAEASGLSRGAISEVERVDGRSGSAEFRIKIGETLDSLKVEWYGASS